jgi:hypothetical protein
MMTRLMRTGCMASILLASPALVLCQGPAPVAVAPTETQIYEFLFKRVAAQEHLAERVAKKGYNPDLTLAAIKNEAGLTNVEDAALKRIASQCNSRVAEIGKQAAPLIVRGRQELSANPSVEPSDADQVRALQASRTAALAQCTDQLRTAFGPERFTRFDAWVRSTAAQHIRAYRVPVPTLQRREPK